MLTGGYSRHALVEWQNEYELKKVLDIDEFNKDMLYKSLDWLAENKEKLEDELFKNRGTTPMVYLYDVSSTYLEGTKNEFGAFGYNRDKKKGKMQITYGLMTDKDGVPIPRGYVPISIDIFKGNTSDTQTVENQLQKIKNRV